MTSNLFYEAWFFKAKEQDLYYKINLKIKGLSLFNSFSLFLYK